MESVDQVEMSMNFFRAVSEMQNVVGECIRSMECMTRAARHIRLDLEALNESLTIAASRIEQATQSQEDKPFGNQEAQQANEDMKTLVCEYNRLQPIVEKFAIVFLDDERAGRSKRVVPHYHRGYHRGPSIAAWLAAGSNIGGSRGADEPPDDPEELAFEV